MRCRECELLLWAYVDDELPDDQRLTVERHLDSCSRCSRSLDQLRAFPIQKNRLQVITPPPDFTVRLMQRITPLPTPQEIANQRQIPAIWHGPLGMAVALTTAAAAIFLGLLSTAAMTISNNHLGFRSGDSAERIANAIGEGVVFAFWNHLTWSVAIVFLGLLATLTLLWVRIIATRH